MNRIQFILSMVALWILSGLRWMGWSPTSKITKSDCRFWGIPGFHLERQCGVGCIFRWNGSGYDFVDFGEQKSLFRMLQAQKLSAESFWKRPMEAIYSDAFYQPDLATDVSDEKAFAAMSSSFEKKISVQNGL